MKLQLTFEYQGRERVLNKHPRVQSALDANPPTMTEEAARNQPWYLRAKIPPADMKPYKLSAKDKDAIRGACDLLKSARTDDFKAFVEDRRTKEGMSVFDLATEWIKEGLPLSATENRTVKQASELQERVERALVWPGWKKPALAIKRADHDAYVLWRVKNARAGCDGRRSCDIELAGLSCMGQWAVCVDKLDANPFATRVRYQKREAVKHCHSFTPGSDEEFHRVLSWFWTAAYTNQSTRSNDTRLSVIKRITRTAGAWLAFTGLTGIRPEEPGYLYRHARMTKPPAIPKDVLPGTIFPTRDAKWLMRVVRTKRGQNPFVTLTPAALDFLGTWEAWLDDNFTKPEAPGVMPWFPHAGTNGQLCPPPPADSDEDGDTTLLNKRLDRACVAMGLTHRLKPKGFGRAFYVRVRRSEGADDAVIAGELGQTTNGELIRTTYGNPDDLRGGAMFDWQAEDETHKSLPYSWQVLGEKAEQPANVINL